MRNIDRDTQFQSVLSRCQRLDAELSINREQRYFTIGTRTAWNDPAIHRKAKELQTQVQSLSKEYPNVVYYCFEEDIALIYVV